MSHRRTGRTGRRRYSEQERAARAREDARLMDEAQAHLADPDLVASRTEHALGLSSSRILGYSIANQMLLWDQAEERDIALRDVDTFLGWTRRGRQVRKGERGLRIVRPVGLEDPEPDSEEAIVTDRDEEPKPRFRFMSVFDISQTFVVAVAEEGEAACTCGAESGEPCRDGCGCPGCTGQLDATTDDAEQEPGHVAWNRLQEQITAAGYRFNYPAKPADLAGNKLRVDHPGRTVHVGMAADATDHDALTQLAVILADLLTRAAAERTAAGGRRALEAAPPTE